MRVWFLAAFVACGKGLPAQAPSEIVLVRQPEVKAPHAAFSIVPADLLDDAAVARIRHRVRVRWLRRASPIHATPSEPVIAREQSTEIDRIMPVIGESGTEIRVVAEDDDARLALWIDRRDAWPTLLVPVQLGDREGRVFERMGAWISTGAPIDVAFGRDRVRHVTLRDPDVVIDGWVPAAAVGNVWLAAPGDTVDLVGRRIQSYAPPTDTRAKTQFVEHATLRASADATAPIVATVLGADVIGFINARGPWVDVEVVRRHARIRGFVRASELAPIGEEPLRIGTTGGHGFGMSHAQRVVVAAGTCLFDAANGQVVGVQIKESTRYGERDIDVDGWSRVYVNSPWAVLGFFVHDRGGDPKQPVWESCARR
jgi:hypothetical protein